MTTMPKGNASLATCEHGIKHILVSMGSTTNAAMPSIVRRSRPQDAQRKSKGWLLSMAEGAWTAAMTNIWPLWSLTTYAVERKAAI